jgi:cupin superfamily acireductone dioxygenase involved in methionine salvage
MTLSVPENIEHYVSVGVNNELQKIRKKIFGPNYRTVFSMDVLKQVQLG